MTRSAFTLLLAGLSAVGSVGCRGQKSEKPPIVPIRNMHYQPRYGAQGRSDLFSDQRELRPPVQGTVDRNAAVDPAVIDGRIGDTWALTIPARITAKHGGAGNLASRGQERFNIYCAPCHGYDGLGKGSVVKKAGSAGGIIPPSLYDARLRNMPDGQLYATIANGIRSMPGYAHSIPLEDRWAIVAYVRALQMRQPGEAVADAADSEEVTEEDTAEETVKQGQSS